MALFEDRVDAGRKLAARLAYLRGEPVVVLGLPRGGVPVAAEVAKALEVPLDVVIVRKLGVPFQPEYGMGAIAEEGARVLNQRVIDHVSVTPDQLAAVERAERVKLEARVARLREMRSPIDLHGRTALVIDDGLATGATARAACVAARLRGAERVVLAAPVAPPSVREEITEADDVVCLAWPDAFMAVGQFYDDFSQTSDDDVLALLAQAAQREHHRANRAGASVAARAAAAEVGRDDEVVIEAGAVAIEGRFTAPARARGVVVFAHGSGSSRRSPRNVYVASVLQQAGIGTLLIDLLTPAEAEDRANVFDIGLLASRLGAAIDWVLRHPAADGCRIGVFGASTGAAAALVAAADRAHTVAAVVSRGGRPDLAGDRLPDVTAPTLLIVGGDDHQVLQLNRDALARLGGPARLMVVEGATHLFEEPGALEQAADHARDWFVRHLLGGETGGEGSGRGAHRAE